MLTLQEALADQEDLIRLCADRPSATNEIFEPNAYYGNDLVLKEYAGLPQSYQLKVVIPHGVVLAQDEGWVWGLEAAAVLPVVLCYPPYRERSYREHTNKRVVLSAAPFLYVAEMLKNGPHPERNGTLFFPSHSTHWDTAYMDDELLAKQLSLLPDEYQPITICMYWRDFNLGRHLPFQNRGMKIVSAGHIYQNQYFLHRLYHLCSLHRYASGNSLGSHIFMSVTAGCSYFHFDKVAYSVKTGVDIGLAETNHKIASDLTLLFSVPGVTMTDEQMATVDYYLGRRYLRSPTELRKQLQHAERLDKFGFGVRNRGRKTQVMPTYYRRSKPVWESRARSRLKQWLE